MNPNTQDNNVFIMINLLLIAIILLMALVQFFIWLKINIKKQKIKNVLNKKTYHLLLEEIENQNIIIKKRKWLTKFNNYQSKTNTLKLKNKDFEEKTIWNCYQNLISVTLIKWKKAKNKTNITLIVSTLFFYLSVIMTIICALIYYINLWQNTINNINTTILNIFGFITLLILVLSWLIWTMSYEKLRKEIIILATKLNDENFLKFVKWISGYKTLFPSSELLW